MVLTVIVTSGFGSLANAAAPQAGDLIKMDGLSSVYYLGADGKRYVFPTSSTYFSWYKDFSGVITVSASELQSYPLGSNVTMRPGTKLVKITTDPSVYAVTPNSVLRKVASEADAIKLYGTSWAKRVVDVPDAFFTNYTIGSALASGEVPAGSLVKNSGAASVYYYDGSNYRNIASEAAFNANNFSFDNVLTVSSTVAASGSAISGSESTIVSPTGATTGVTPNAGTGLTVSLSAATPAAANVPQNGVRIPFTTLNLTASKDGASTINSIVVKRTGLSSYNSFDKIWAEKDGVTVASKKSLNSNDEATLVFSPALTVNAGQTVSLDIIGSFTAINTQGGNASLSVVSASSISANGITISGSFPITGNLMSLTSYSVVNLGISQNGSTGISAKVGDTGIELGSFTLQANTPAKDVTVKTITLKNNGVEDLAKAASNLYLEQAGVKVSTSASVNGRFVTFTLNNGAYDILKDDGSKSFKIKGDIIAKENSVDSKTPAEQFTAGTGSFVFALNKSTDLNAIEKGTGFGANVVSGTTSADNYKISSVVITSGAINLSKKTTSPSDTTIVKGNNGIVALIANFKADEAMTADGLNINYGSTMGGAAATTDQFQNAKVYLNGALVDSFDPATSTTFKTVNLDSSISINKGDNEVKVIVDSKADAANSSAIKFWLGNNVLDNENAEYVQSGNKVLTSEIGGSAEGAVLTVGKASLSMAESSGYATNKAIVKGSTAVSLGKFTVKATNDDVTITSAQLTGTTTATTTTSANSIYDMKLYVDGAQVGNTVDYNGSGANFSSLNITVKKDTTRTIEVFGSFDSAAVEGSHFKTALTLYSQDSKGKSVDNVVANTTEFAVSGQGDLNVALGGNTPSAALLPANTSEQEVAQFKFTATNDSASLTELYVYNYASGTLDASADSRVSLVKLYDGTTLIDSFTPVFGGGKFTISNDKAKVLASQSKTLSVKVVLNSIDNDASATNKVLSYAITGYKFKSSNGTESVIGNTTDGSARVNGLTANAFTIRKTVPTVAFLALPDTALNAGTKDIAKFTVSADASGDVTLKQIVLDVATTTNATLTAADKTQAVKVNGSLKTVATSSLSMTNGSGKYTIIFDSPEVISAGSSKTFEIQGVTSVSNQGSDSITAKIAEDSTFDSATSIITSDPKGDTALTTITPGDFVWSDGADNVNYTWANGYRVSGLTTNTWVLSK